MNRSTKTGHTPGPWKLAKSALGGYSGMVLAQHETGIASVCNYLPQQTLPNARLIAAAPDLLDALKGLSDMYAHAWDIVDGGLFMNENSVKRFEKVHAAAEKALAKATNEQ